MRNLSVVLLFLSYIGVSNGAEAKIKVGTTTTDLEALVQVVGQEHVETFSVAKGTQDPHQIEAKPSFMIKFRSVDLVLSQGLELESAWLVPLINGSRNTKILKGTKGFLELGPLLDPIDKMTGPVSRIEGDIHPEGNPHFQLDPIRLGAAAMIIADRLGEMDPENLKLYQGNALKFKARMEEKTKEWQKRIQNTSVKEFVSYHKTLSYFATRFGLKNTLHLEPKPGIPPTASHIIKIIQEMKKNKVQVVLIENFFDDSIRAKLIEGVSQAQVIKVPVSVGGESAIKTNEDLIEHLVQVLEKASK